jgi:hypothetical protein
MTFGLPEKLLFRTAGDNDRIFGTPTRRTGRKCLILQATPKAIWISICDWFTRDRRSADRFAKSSLW